MLITKKDGLNELLDSAKRYNIMYEFDNNDNVIVYHGTSQYAADKIEETGHFQDGFFFHDIASLESDGGNYADIRSKQKGETNGGVNLKMLVDPRCILINGAGETESDGDLYRDSDGVWKTEAYLNKNLPNNILKSEIEVYEELYNRTYSKEFENDKLYHWVWRTFNHYYNTEKIGIEGSIKKLLSDIEYYVDCYYDYDMEDVVNEYETIDDYIEYQIDDGYYDSEEEFRESEESIVNAFAFKDFMDGFDLTKKQLGNALDELNDEDVINPSLFITYINESKLVYSYKYFIEKRS